MLSFLTWLKGAELGEARVVAPVGESHLFFVALPDPGAFQGCQMVYDQTKNQNLGTLWRALECKILLYFLAIWNILRPLDIFYGRLMIL
jgi:hypothetical protein